MMKKLKSLKISVLQLKYLFGLFLVCFMTFIANSQRYRVEMRITNVECCYSERLGFDGTVSYQGVNYSFLGEGPGGDNGFEVIFDREFDYLPTGSLEFYDITTRFANDGQCRGCGGSGISYSFTPSTSPDQFCVSQSHDFPAGTYANFHFSVTITPILSIDAEVGNYCSEDGLDLATSHPGFGNAYNWSYRVEGSTAYTPLAGATNTDSQNLTPDQIFGSNYEDFYGDEFYIALDLGGCMTERGAFRFYPDPPVVQGLTTNEVSDVTCNGGSDGAISFTASARTSRGLLSGESFIYMLYQGEEPTFSDLDDFDISFRQVTATTLNRAITFSNLPPDDYWIFIYPEGTGSTASGCGEASFYQVTIEEPTAINVTSSSELSPACRDGDASFMLNVNNGTPGFTYRLNSSYGTIISANSSTSRTPSFDLSVLAYPQLLNDFSVHITDANGCTAETGTISGFSNPSLLSIASVSVEGIVCNGESTDLTVVLEEPVPDNGTITYSIDGYAAAQSSETFSVPAGTYTVRVTNTVGSETCVDTETVTITEPTVVSGVFENMSPPTCTNGSDGSFEVSATGGTGSYTYSIPGSPDNSTGVFSGLIPGMYTVNITDESGCAGDFSVEVVDDPFPLMFDVSVTNQSCSYEEDGIIEVINITNEISSNITYSYYSTLDDFTYDNGNDSAIDDLRADSYDVFIDDGTCEAFVFDVIVGTPLPLSASFIMDSVICNAELNGELLVNVTGGTTPYSYLWEHDGSISSTITAGADIYTVEITDANECELTDSFEILEPFELTAEYESTNITCFNAADGTITLVNINGGNGQYSYEWSDDPMLNSSMRTNLSGDFYDVTISDHKGCSYTIADIEIVDPEQVALRVIEQANVNCHGDYTGLLIVEMTGGVGSYEYSINNGVTWQSEPDFIGLSTGEYTVLARDTNGCEGTVTTTITEPSAPLSVSLEEVDATCETDGVITAIVSGGTAPYTYSWEGLDDIASTIEVPAGNYPLTVIDANGCVITTAGNITSLDGAQVTIEDQLQPSCSYNADGTASISIVGISPFTVLWDHGEIGTEVNELSIGENWYSVIDANGCMVREVVTFDLPQPLLVNVIEMELPSCNGASDGSLTITVTGGDGNYALNWENDVLNVVSGSSGTILSGLSAGDYPAQIIDRNACALDTVITLPDKGLLELAINSSNPSCFESMDGAVEAVVTGGNGNYTYTWSNGVDLVSQSGLNEGTYSVTVTDALGCEISDSTTLVGPPLTEVNIEDIAICSGQSYQVVAPVDAQSYDWVGPDSYSSEGRAVVVSDPGIYELTITDLIGCDAKETFEVVIDDDAINAVFLVVGTAYVGDTLLLIDVTWPIPNEVSWELPDGARVISRTLDYAEVVFDEPGDYDLSMYCEWGGCEASYQQIVTITTGSEVTGRAFEFLAPEEPLINQVSIHPNPTSDRANLTIVLKEKASVEVSIVDLSGNEVSYYETLNGSAAYGLRIATDLLLPGLYFLMVEASNETKALRLIVR